MEFQKTVLTFYRKEGRHTLPWRTTKNPYRILVSEVMLQQTQVERVIPYYKAFLKKFPTIQALAEASLGDVLRVWQGLGYNRRAKMLHEAVKTTMINHSGRMPREYDALVALSGVGEYTARAIRVFAYNKPEVMIETNIRAVFLHHFFTKKENISDKEIVSYMIQSGIPKNTEPRAWYASLMDYGSYLKKTHPNPSRKSTHHIKQKSFKGSDREIRGALLRAVSDNPQTILQLQKLPFEKERTKTQVNALLKEGLLEKKGRWYRLP